MILQQQGRLLSLSDLSVGYGGTPLLPPISLSVESGQLWGMIGRNGSGKTTLLRTVLGLLPAVRGIIEKRSDLRVGYVAQRSSIDAGVPARVVDVIRGGFDRGWSFCLPLRRDVNARV